MSGMSVLQQVLRQPLHCTTLTDEQWDHLLRQARASRLLGTLAFLLPEQHLSALPSVQRALVSARIGAEATVRHTRHELRLIAEALQPLQVPVVLLKGAAYMQAGLRAHQGRLFSDVDILVPREALNAVEDNLRFSGYMSTHHTAYDQRYYRVWMHELPPMQHMTRGTTLDVHHNILPLTARAKIDSDLLLQNAQKKEGDFFSVLAPVDMVIHSIVHLFYDGEWDHALRDGWDLHCLLQQFGDDAFWSALMPRAEQLNVARPVFYALRLVQELFDTAVPATVLQEATRFAGPHDAWMQSLFHHAAQPPHHSWQCYAHRQARLLLFIRGHWLRMPPHLLIPHLLRKAITPLSANDYTAN